MAVESLKDMKAEPVRTYAARGDASPDPGDEAIAWSASIVADMDKFHANVAEMTNAVRTAFGTGKTSLTSQSYTNPF